MTYLSCFFFNDTATTEIYTYLHTLSLHDALPIYCLSSIQPHLRPCRRTGAGGTARHLGNGVRAPGRLSSRPARRSEEHTSELQSLMRISYAVFCLKKKKKKQTEDKHQHSSIIVRYIHTNM